MQTLSKAGEEPKLLRRQVRLRKEAKMAEQNDDFCNMYRRRNWEFKRAEIGQRDRGGVEVNERWLKPSKPLPIFPSVGRRRRSIWRWWSEMEVEGGSGGGEYGSGMEER
ncbi:hypothetical protein L2E82_17238 [Cichorium intybus]|uniref:Uncharacterized protein n=1 Tax=Cichorium intybus TaxID=13427 RepID=A0ACB9F876_CICIN|nr:hypothetical protein L2E82_17238 [Cichorium intybus]